MRKKGIFDLLLKELEDLEKENMKIDNPEEDQDRKSQVFSNNGEDLIAKEAYLPTTSSDMSKLSTDVQYSDITTTPGTESQIFDPQEFYGVQEQPTRYEDDTIFDKLIINDANLIDWSSVVN